MPRISSMMKRNKRTTSKIKEKHSLPKAIIWFAMLVAIFVCYELIVKVAEPALFPIKQIKLNAHLTRINPNVVKAHIAPLVRGFFSTDAMAIKNEVLKIPFIDEVVVKRLWPDTLLVTLAEQQFVAAWGDGEAISSKGELVHVRPDPSKHLPKFVGPEGQSKLMLEQYNAMMTALLPYNLAITLLNLNSRRSWQMTLNNGIKVILGRNEVATRLDTLATIYCKLKKRHGDSIEVIDLRHPNGVCVRLKGAAL
jgi:cell division protein FtsQ